MFGIPKPKSLILYSPRFGVASCARCDAPRSIDQKYDQKCPGLSVMEEFIGLCMSMIRILPSSRQLRVSEKSGESRDWKGTPENMIGTVILPFLRNRLGYDRSPEQNNICIWSPDLACGTNEAHDINHIPFLTFTKYYTTISGICITLAKRLTISSFVITFLGAYSVEHGDRERRIVKPKGGSWNPLPAKQSGIVKPSRFLVLHKAVRKWPRE